MKNSMHKLRSLSIAFDLVSFLLSFGLSYSISDYSQKPKGKEKTRNSRPEWLALSALPNSKSLNPKSNIMDLRLCVVQQVCKRSLTPRSNAVS